MPHAFQFENFVEGSRQSNAPAADGNVSKKIDASYENGYKAGWDDASDTIAKENNRISADLARSLTSITCDVADIRAELLSSFQPLLKDITETILPKMAQQVLGPTILEALRPMIEADLESGIQVVVHGDNFSEVETLIQNATNVPLEIRKEDTLGQGQVFIRVGANERSVDLDEIVGNIQQAVGAFFNELTAEKGAENAG